MKPSTTSHLNTAARQRAYISRLPAGRPSMGISAALALFANQSYYYDYDCPPL